MSKLVGLTTYPLLLNLSRERLGFTTRRRSSFALVLLRHGAIGIAIMRLHIILVNLGFFIFLSPRVHHVDGFASSSIGAENLPHPSTKSNAVQYVGKTIESFKLGEINR